MSIEHRNFTRVAIAIVLVIAVGASLWFVSPPPVKALDIIITTPEEGTLGQEYPFTVTINVTDIDVLPVAQIDLEIYNVANPLKKATLVGLPLQTSNKTAHTIKEGTASGSAEVAAYAVAVWGYGTAYRWGYGYRDSDDWGLYYFYPGTTSGGYGYKQSPYKGTALITYYFYWTSPSGWPEGDYEIKALVSGSATKKFSETSELFWLAPPSTTPTGPVGAGGGGQPGVISLLEYMWEPVEEDGLG